MPPLHHPTLPLELIDEIVQATLEHGPVESSPGLNEKPPWKLISSLSLTCKAYRILVLKAWFFRLYTKDPEDTTQLTDKSKAEKTCVKYIHCVYSGSKTSRPFMPWDLEGYSRLEMVRLDRMPLNSGRHSSDGIPFMSIPSTVVHFELRVRGHFWPYPNAYTFIPRCFPYLKKLVLYQPNVWCGLCFTVNSVEIAETVPDRLVYTDGFGLPIHYARVLEPMLLLEYVSINLPVYKSGLATLSNKGHMWTGECESCNQLLCADDAFASNYVSRKKRGIIRLADGTERRCQRAPSLKSVEWTLFPANADNAYDPLHFGAEFSEAVDTDSGEEDYERAEILED